VFGVGRLPILIFFFFFFHRKAVNFKLLPNQPQKTKDLMEEEEGGGEV